MKKLLSVLLSIILLLSLCSCTDTSMGSELPLLEVHFLDVGQADSTLVLCGDDALLIDGGNRADSSFIYSYLSNMEVDRLDYIIATHPHEDHIGGIMGALSYSDADVLYSCTDNDENSYFESLQKRLKERNIPLKVPEIGDSFNVGEAKVTFIGPVEYTNDANDNSLCVKIEYGDISFLFTGDAGYGAEKRLIQSGTDLESTVLQVGHHGSSTASCYEFLREVGMKYAVISSDSNSMYGHPHESTLSRLKDAGADIYRTDKQGTIVFKTNGSALTVTTEKNVIAETSEGSINYADCMYIGNINSEKYHRRDCRSLPDEKNRVYFMTLEDVIKSGYSPCGTCKP